MHKVIFKFKQGDKVIGQTYWISVYDNTTAECAQTAAAEGR
jgi:hypothetical protein